MSAGVQAKLAAKVCRRIGGWGPPKNGRCA